MLQNHARQWLLTGLAAVCMNAHAAEWIAEPSLSIREEYNDNFRLTSTPHDDVWGTIADPRLTLGRRTELWDLDANARLRAAHYFGQDGLNTIDNFLDIKSIRRLERGSWNASASLANDTTLQNETLDLDTGLVTNQIDRSQQSFNLGAQYRLTETTGVEASASYRTIKYDDGARFGLADYETQSPLLRLTHRINPKIQILATLAHSQTNYDDATEQESKSNSMKLGLAYDITETWLVSGSIGSQRTRISRLGIVSIFPTVIGRTETETTALVYDLVVNRQFETGNIALSATRSATPSSTGVETDTTSVTLTANHRFTGTLSSNIIITYLQSEAISGARALADNDRYRISPSLSWRLDRDLTLNTGYSYTRVSRNTSNAESNAAFISLGYTWPRAAISR